MDDANQALTLNVSRMVSFHDDDILLISLKSFNQVLVMMIHETITHRVGGKEHFCGRLKRYRSRQ